MPTLNTAVSIVYCLYTQNYPNLVTLVSRYFPSATLYDALGIWESDTEQACVIEVIGVETDLQDILHLAGDIRIANNQQSVIVTRHSVDTFTLGF